MARWAPHGGASAGGFDRDSRVEAASLSIPLQRGRTRRGQDFAQLPPLSDA